MRALGRARRLLLSGDWGCGGELWGIGIAGRGVGAAQRSRLPSWREREGQEETWACEGRLKAIEKSESAARQRRFSSSSAGIPEAARQPIRGDEVPAAGQPLPHTHPGLLAPDEIAPGLTAVELASRREALAASLGEGDCCLLTSAAPTYMAGIIPYPYRPDPDFFYLTGITQAGCAAVLRSLGPRGDSSYHLTLLVPDRNVEAERWDGEALRPAAATMFFEAHYATEMRDAWSVLESVAHGKGRVHCDWDRLSGRFGLAMEPLRQQLHAQGRLGALAPIMARQRWVKSASEQRLMRESAHVAANALRHAMRVSEPGVPEAVVAATFEYHCKALGAQRMAYPPVVASGRDATTAHYIRNDKVLQDGQLLLMDAGCERHGYASDITRTWPVNGRFTPPQRAVYNIVFDAHRACLAAVRPGCTMRALQAVAVSTLSRGLARLGVLGAIPAETIVSSAIYRIYFPHAVGHWLGLDTHDVPLVPAEQEFVPGTVLTVEPGLYLPAEPRFGPYGGIGVRIEDDVLVTDSGAEVLSGGLPVASEEVEGLVQELRGPGRLS